MDGSSHEWEIFKQVPHLVTFPTSERDTLIVQHLFPYHTFKKHVVVVMQSISRVKKNKDASHDPVPSNQIGSIMVQVMTKIFTNVVQGSVIPELYR